MKELWRLRRGALRGIGLGSSNGRGSAAALVALTHSCRTFCGGTTTTPPSPSSSGSAGTKLPSPHQNQNYHSHNRQHRLTRLDGASVHSKRFYTVAAAAAPDAASSAPRAQSNTTRSFSTAPARLCPASTRISTSTSTSTQTPTPTTTPPKPAVTMAEEQKWPAAKVRETFLKFFEGKEHTIGTLPLLPLHP